MTIKTNGAEFKRFYYDPEFWPDGVWHDDTQIVVDGIDDPDAALEKISDGASVSISGGYVIGADQEDLGLFESYFKRWRRGQSHRAVLVEIGKGDEDKLAELLKQIGGKVIA